MKGCANCKRKLEFFISIRDVEHILCKISEKCTSFCSLYTLFRLCLDKLPPDVIFNCNEIEIATLDLRNLFTNHPHVVVSTMYKTYSALVQIARVIGHSSLNLTSSALLNEMSLLHWLEAHLELR